MSATGFMPGAARTHLLARPDWAMPDTLPDGLTIFNSSPVADGKLLAVGSTPYRERDQPVISLAAGYAPGLVRDLDRLAAEARTTQRWWRMPWRPRWGCRTSAPDRSPTSRI